MCVHLSVGAHFYEASSPGSLTFSMLNAEKGVSLIEFIMCVKYGRENLAVACKLAS